MKAKASSLPKATGPTLPDGSRVLVLRPNLWSGVVGTVESSKDSLHRVMLAGVNGSTFHADVAGDEMVLWPFEKAPIKL